MATKWTTAPTATPNIKLSRIIQTITNEKSDGTVTIKAIIVPFKAISRIESFGFLSSDNGKKFEKW